MKISFDKIFTTNPYGSVTPNVQVQIEGITMSPGVTFTQGVAFSGIDLASYKGHDLEVEIQDNVYTITKIY